MFMFIKPKPSLENGIKNQLKALHWKFKSCHYTYNIYNNILVKLPRFRESFLFFFTFHKKKMKNNTEKEKEKKRYSQHLLSARRCLEYMSEQLLLLAVR